MSAALREELGGFRFYLEGEPIHAGDVIEIETGAGWRRVRFEWSARRLDNVALYDGGEDPAFSFHPSMFTRAPVRWPVKP